MVVLPSGEQNCNYFNKESEPESNCHGEETEETNEVLNEEADSLIQENGQMNQC